jgi:hypothetical protein
LQRDRSRVFRADIPVRYDFHVGVQEPVNNKVHDARTPSIFLGFNLFAPFPLPFEFPTPLVVRPR